MGFRGRRRAREAVGQAAAAPKPEPTEPKARARWLLEESLTKEQLETYDKILAGELTVNEMSAVTIRGGTTGKPYYVHPSGAVFGYCVMPVLDPRVSQLYLPWDEDRFLALKLWIEGDEMEFLNKARPM